MHRRFISIVAMLMAMTLCLTGCTSEASNIGKAKDKKTVDTGFIAATAGSYDSADTAVVISTDQENSAVVFMNMETGKQYTLYYDGTTYVKDKYDGPMTISQIEPGDVVDVTFLKGKRRLASIKRSPQAWIYEEIENYDLGGPNKTANIGSNTYSLPDDVVVLSEGRRSEVMDVVKQDVVTISGIDHKIYSISVERGHGYLRLKNDQALIGGWIEVGNSVIREITEDMLLVVPEGSYQVLLSHNGASCIKDVLVERNKEVVLDVGDLEITENKTGRILFSVTPDTAKVSIDGKAVDISKAVELPYGIHQVHLEAKGYDSLTKYIQVGSEYATISFELEEERDDDDRRTVSSNTIDDYQPAEPVKEEENQESLSENALGATSGNRVYIDSPRNVEVYLDGNYIGLSPVSFGKTVGSHTITLRKSGYKTRSYTIYLYNDGKDTTYSFSELERETVSGNTTKPDNPASNNGSVSDNTLITVHVEEPEDVQVYLDDELVGISPLSFQKKAGQYKVTLSKEGYESKSYSIYLYSNRADVTYRLDPLNKDSGGQEKETGNVKIIISPENVSVKVTIDDKLYEDISGEIELEYGEHKIKIEAEGYKTIDNTFEVNAESKELPYDLEKEEENPDKPGENPDDKKDPDDDDQSGGENPGGEGSQGGGTDSGDKEDQDNNEGSDDDGNQDNGTDSGGGDNKDDSVDPDGKDDQGVDIESGNKNNQDVVNSNNKENQDKSEGSSKNSGQVDGSSSDDSIKQKTDQTSTNTTTTTERIVQNSNSRRRR